MGYKLYTILSEKYKKKTISHLKQGTFFDTIMLKLFFIIISENN